jgi:N-acetylglucosamine-6-phosphate deacetylase
MLKTVLKGNVILEDKILSGGAVVIEGERISGVFPQEHELPEKEINYFDYEDKFISPGLIDLHLHGALGKDVMDADVESIKQIAVHQACCGVTGFLAGTTSSSLDSILKALEAVKKAAELPQPSEILGVYIEGPFLNQERKGAQDPDFIRGIYQEDISLLIEATSGLSTIISIAPEVNNNMSFIKPLKEKGIVVSIGHSDATYQQALYSFKQGITHATHLFNAMSGYHHREPGVAGAVFDSPEVTAEVIADGVHLHPSAVRLAVARKGEDKICLITDSLKAAGLGDGIYQMGNLEFEVKGTEARLKESGVLVGSVMTLNKAVKNVIGWTGVSINKGVNMASLNPARVLGLDDEIGSIQEGKYANLAVFDTEFKVVETIRRGCYGL